MTYYGWGRGVGVPRPGGVRCGVARGEGVAPGCGVSVEAAVGLPDAVPVGEAPAVGDEPGDVTGGGFLLPGVGVVAPPVTGFEFPNSADNAPDCWRVVTLGWGNIFTPINNAPTSAAATNAPAVRRRSSTPSPPS